MIGYCNEELYVQTQEEGLDYTFRHAVKLDNIEDLEVKKAAKEYVAAAKKLETLLDSKVTEQSLRDFLFIMLSR